MKRGDLLDGVNNSRVVPVAEFSADRRVAEVCELAKQVHRDLTRDDERTPPAWPNELFDTEAEVFGADIDDLACGDLPWLFGAYEIGQNGLSELTCRSCRFKLA